MERAEMVVYIDIGFGGLHMHVYDSIPDLNKVSTTGYNAINRNILPTVNLNPWNDRISALQILGGTWRVYKDPNYQNQLGGDLRPGFYPDIQKDLNIPHDQISSIKLVNQNPIP
jgi:hypothetical protein